MIVNKGNKQRFKDKMCKIVQDKQGEDAILGQPGKKIGLYWSIKNDSKHAWPRFPILRNVTNS